MTILKKPSYCIHGFLGKSSDWDFILPQTPTAHRINLFPKRATSDSDYRSNDFSLSSLASFINSTARRAPEPPILIGYSLGGRIALHCVLAAPELYQGVVIVSGHPGLSHPHLREIRIRQDEEWSQLFEKADWKQVVSQWNSQLIFRGSQKMESCENENDYSRQALASCLREASLGKQKDLRDPLKSLEVPILWMAGEYDLKFCALADEMCQLLKKSQMSLIKNAGHRAPWDQPKAFQGHLEQAFKYIFKI